MIITIYYNEVASKKKGNLATYSMDSGTKIRFIGNDIVESDWNITILLFKLQLIQFYKNIR